MQRNSSYRWRTLFLDAGKAGAVEQSAALAPLFLLSSTIVASLAPTSSSTLPSIDLTQSPDPYQPMALSFGRLLSGECATG